MEEIILVIIVKHTEDSSIFSSRICTRVFLQLGMKFLYEREDFCVEMYIFISLVVFGTYGRSSKVGEMK